MKNGTFDHFILFYYFILISSVTRSFIKTWKTKGGAGVGVLIDMVSPTMIIEIKSPLPKPIHFRVVTHDCTVKESEIKWYWHNRKGNKFRKRIEIERILSVLYILSSK